MAPRITPGSFREVGPVAWIVSWVSGRVQGTAPPNIFLTLGRNKGLLLGWVHFAGKMMPGGKIPNRDTEMIILRVARARECEYEILHHEIRAKKYGYDESAVPSARDGVLLAATDELLATRNLSDETWASLRSELNEKQAIEFLMLVGHYDMLATTINTLRVEPDPH